MRIVVFIFILTCSIGYSQVQYHPLQISSFVENFNKKSYKVNITLSNQSNVNLYIEYPIGFDIIDLDAIYYFNRRGVHNNIFTFYTGLSINSHSSEPTGIVPKYNFIELEDNKSIELTFYLSKKLVNNDRGMFVFRYAFTDEAFNTFELYEKNVFDKVVIINFD